MASTKNGRLGDYSAGQNMASTDQSSGLNMFTNSAWTGGNIWGSSGSTLGNGAKMGDSTRGQGRPPLSGADSGSDAVTLDRSEEIVGSGALLSSSESEGWVRRNSTQWPPLGTTNMSNGLSNGRAAAAHGSSSPVRSRTNQHTRSNSPYGNPLAAIGTAASVKTSHLDPSSRPFNSTGLFNGVQASAARANGTENGRSMDPIHFGAAQTNGMSSYNGYASSTASRSGSLPPSRHGNEPPQFGDFTNPFQATQNENFTHRRNEPSRGSNFAMATPQMPRGEPNWNSVNDLSGMSRMDLNRDSGDNYTGWENAYQMSPQGGMNGSFNASTPQRNGSMSYDQDSRIPQALQQQFNRYQNQLYGNGSSQVSNGHDSRRGHDSSPMYANSTPPVPEHHRAPSTSSFNSAFGALGNNADSNPNVLERKLRNLQAQQYAMQANPNLAYRQNQQQQYYPYGGNITPQALARMGINQPYFPNTGSLGMNPHQMNGAHGHRVPPRGPAVESPSDANIRSALMEEFRSSKGNRKWELKDIYQHIVEFSGDQHGSRFIQGKLETANSDEKAQLFSEISPNAWQLMTDVFGNYVIQKFFEHGNQTQKKQLADKMKGHIADLSLQMYGCRVVQKAFEHILDDQQAILVKELEPDILKTIKDQNGNHVVQKAIQRIPAEHITFINKAVTGNVFHLAAHSYGCRVIQRMLEFCPPQARNEVIDELHSSALNLIVDQYGNYVVQNVMDHGREEDRLKLIEITIDKVLVYSRHKYASNVVEHCLRNGSPEHRNRIVDIIRGNDEKGEPRLNHLVRDQYANYVVQTVMKLLQGAELRSFVDQVKASLEKVRNLAYGKHIAQIEKLIDEKTKELAASHVLIDTSAAPTPPPLIQDTNSPGSVSQPSTTNNSTIDGPLIPVGDDSQKATDTPTAAEATS